MKLARNNSFSDNDARRPLPVEWLDNPGAPAFHPAIQFGRRTAFRRDIRALTQRRSSCQVISRPSRSSWRAFTLLELTLVIAIIGLVMALSLPHLAGYTKGNTMVGATRQLLDDLSLARQRAIVNRAQVCMVFLPPGFWTNSYTSGGASPGQPPTADGYCTATISNLYSHQYAAYALIAQRSVGDQPGISNVHYLTDWRFLPQGVYISPYQIVNPPNNYYSLLVTTTNTTTQPIGSNGFYITPFQTNQFPFPTTYTNGSGYIFTNNLPCIAFTPSGQLAAGSNQYIMLTAGSIFYPMDANNNPAFLTTPDLVGTPPGNETNNPHLIDIDWLTGRAKLEQNQF